MTATNVVKIRSAHDPKSSAKLDLADVQRALRNTELAL
jgi:hypothetical protein